MYERMQAFFVRDEWPIERVDGQPALWTGFATDVGEWRCFAIVREAQEQFVFYSICPVNTPPDQRQALAEFLTRANYGLIIGNFEMDFGDGEIRFKTSIDVEGDRLRHALIRQAVYNNVWAMHAYLPAMLKVIHGELSPTAAIALAEGGDGADEAAGKSAAWDELAADTVDGER